MAAQFTTIGHSNRTRDEFIGLLREVRVGLLVDVRSFPRSRTNPIFNIDRLPDALRRDHGIASSKGSFAPFVASAGYT